MFGSNSLSSMTQRHTLKDREDEATRKIGIMINNRGLRSTDLPGVCSVAYQLCDLGQVTQFSEPHFSHV